MMKNEHVSAWDNGFAIQKKNKTTGRYRKMGTYVPVRKAGRHDSMRWEE